MYRVFYRLQEQKFRANKKKVCTLSNFVVLYLGGKKTGAKFNMGVE